MCRKKITTISTFGVILLLTAASPRLNALP